MVRFRGFVLVAFLAASLQAAAAPKPAFPPPPFLLPPIPDFKQLVPVPDSQILFAPGTDIVFFDGFWWTQRDRNWYRARDYHKEFTPVPSGYVPAPILSLPPDYRDRYRRVKPIKYRKWKKKYWRPEWDQDRPNEWENRGDIDRHEERDRRGFGGDRDDRREEGDRRGLGGDRGDRHDEGDRRGPGDDRGGQWNRRDGDRN